MATAVPPPALIRCTTSAKDPVRPGSGSSVRAVTATCMPCAASRSAMAAPMPRLAPVTTATRAIRRRPP